MTAEIKKPLNLFQDILKCLEQELVQKVLMHDSLRIERIVSRGHASPPGFWYDQDDHEWVVVLTGKAQLQLEGLEQPITLNSGDMHHLPAHTKHRVTWTAPNQDTIWLAVFWKD